MYWRNGICTAGMSHVKIMLMKSKARVRLQMAPFIYLLFDSKFPKRSAGKILGSIPTMPHKI